MRVTGSQRCSYILGFVGSSTPWDWVQNLAVLPLGRITVDPTFLDPSATVKSVTGHGGFIRLFNTYEIGGIGPVAWYDYLISQGLTSEDILTKLLVCGNSLGGAHAQIFLWQMKAYYESVGYIARAFITGCPNVFYKSGNYELLLKPEEKIILGQTYITTGGDPTWSNGSILMSTPLKGCIVDGVTQIPPFLSKAGKRETYNFTGKLGKTANLVQKGISAFGWLASTASRSLDAFYPGLGTATSSVINSATSITKTQLLQYQIHISAAYGRLNPNDLVHAEEYVLEGGNEGQILVNITVMIERDVKRVRNKWELHYTCQVGDEEIKYENEALFFEPDVIKPYVESNETMIYKNPELLSGDVAIQSTVSDALTALTEAENNTIMDMISSVDTCAVEADHSVSCSAKQCSGCGRSL
jgi:pimeloyl-ACP methyl ester carboxylesterase